MGRALWRELVIGFAGQLGELRLGFTQLAAPLRPGRRQHADRRRARRVDRPLAVGDQPAGRRARPATARRAPPGARGSAPADAAPDPARPRHPARRRSGPGGPVPVGRPAAAHRRAGDRGDGRGGAGDPCHQPARTAHPDAARVEEGVMVFRPPELQLRSTVTMTGHGVSSSPARRTTTRPPTTPNATGRPGRSTCVGRAMRRSG